MVQSEGAIHPPNLRKTSQEDYQISDQDDPRQKGAEKIKMIKPANPSLIKKLTFFMIVFPL